MDMIDEIAGALAKIGDRKLISNFIRSILTEREVRLLATRWQVVKLLREGMSQRKIATMLGVSLCKITRGSRELKKKNSAVKRVMDHTG
jgi:TrpR family trp operon transcriptional repressor